jgi:predicted MFS family arabinose efflux permease
MGHLLAGTRSLFHAIGSYRPSRRESFLLLASITVGLMAGSIAPTPIYSIYQAKWGFTPAAITLIFGVYALAVLAALLTLGRVSDHIGRRPVLIVSLAVQIASMGLFETADGLAGLMIARVVQGLATGAAIGAVGAGLLDLDRERGPIANSITTPIGTALGGMAAGAIVQFLPAPTHLVFMLLAVVYAAQGLGVALMAEPGTPRPGALASLVPQVNVPASVRSSLAAIAPVLVATWARAGLFAALGPALVRSLMSSASPLMSGLAMFAFAGSAGLATLLTRERTPRSLILLGAASLMAGVAMSIAAATVGSTMLFFLGSAVAGSGFGIGFQGAVRTIIAVTTPHQRAGVLSVVFVISYLSMGVPAIAAGYLVTHHGSIVSTTAVFGAAVMALAAMSMLMTLRRPGQI